MLVKEPLIVGLEEQIQVLTHRHVQVGPLRPPGTVNARYALVHEDREEQDRSRWENGYSSSSLESRKETRVAVEALVGKNLHILT